MNLPNDRVKFSDSAFDRIGFFMYQSTGIRLQSSDKKMVYTRLLRRLRELSINTVDDYVDYLELNLEKEHAALIGLLTTHKSYFFRESQQFDLMEKELIPKLLKAHPHRQEWLIWSCACSKGQEPYSIAMILDHMDGFPLSLTKILATDVDSELLEHAQVGVYSEEEVRELPQEYRDKYIRQSRFEQYFVDASVKKLVRFKPLNIVSPWPMKKLFSMIFCRNLLIYFDVNTQHQIIRRLVGQLEQGGYLFFGHSEKIDTGRLGIKHVASNVYIKER